MEQTELEKRDTLRRLTNLIIFFGSQSHNAATARHSKSLEPKRIPIKDIYTKVVGYRAKESPWMGRDKPSTSDDTRPVWTKEAAIRLINHDVEVLQENGFPIRYDVTQGVEREFWIQTEDALPAISFTPKEATLLAMLGQRGTNSELGMFVRNGWSKVGAGVTVEAYDDSLISTLPEDIDKSTTFASINSAIAKRKRLSFTYRSRPKANTTTRTLDPWGIVTSEDRVYLVGFDIDSQEPRCFRFNHIRSANVLKQDQEHVGNEEQVHHAFRESMTRGPQVSVLYHSDYALSPEDTETSESKKEWKSGFLNRDLAVRFFAAQAPEVEVLGPKDFREDVITFLQESQCQ